MRLGLSDTDIALYTSWLGLPWVIKPFWSPFVDISRTKRWWVLAMQVLLGASLAGVAFTLETPFWFQATLACFFLVAFSSATHDIAADGYYMLELSDHDQSFFVGIRNTFYRLAVITGNVGLIPLAAWLSELFPGRNAFAWSLVFYGLAALFIGLALFHSKAMPRPDADRLRQHKSIGEVLHQLWRTLVTFFTKQSAGATVSAIAFLLLFRFPEAMLAKLSAIFLLRPQTEGGLGMSDYLFGLANGIGIGGLVVGGILGGMLASQGGLKRWLWPMVAAITLPDAVYIYMSAALPTDPVLITSLIFIEQFGYGFGFTALTLYMLYLAQGEFRTSHYAICTGITFLGMMLPGMAAGKLADTFGYETFFIIVMASCAITFAVAAFIQLDPEFGKKAKEAA